MPNRHRSVVLPSAETGTLSAHPLGSLLRPLAAFERLCRIEDVYVVPPMEHQCRHLSVWRKIHIKSVLRDAEKESISDESLRIFKESLHSVVADFA